MNESKFIKNPILKGFNPDPSIIRVGEDYYIATSTFEWFPGVQIHHSRDLKNWKLITRPLNRKSQLDMTGINDSCGVWAPCLSYNDGVFYLVYSIVRNIASDFFDVHNYLVTAIDILGEWSEPVYLNSSGFDPSLFHDEDGRKWLVNMSWNFRKGMKSKDRFAGIVLQEYSVKDNKLINKPVNIFKGAIGITEGPHLYKRGGYYYLITAEGGTGAGHAVTVARSRNIEGPYAVDPINPMLTSREKPDLLLQKSGHADIVETQFGEWYMVHLCTRPIKDGTKDIMGRETAIEKVRWTEDGWLRLECGGNEPQEYVPLIGLQEYKPSAEASRDDFESEKLDIQFQTLRIPLKEDTLTLKERSGYLRLYGKESLSSRFHQALIARRQQAFCFTVSTSVEFEPETFNQMAGLTCWYNTSKYYYLNVFHHECHGKSLGLMICDNGNISYEKDSDVCIEGKALCHLQARVSYENVEFFYSFDRIKWIKIGKTYDYTIISGGGFTGAFVGICCQDLDGTRKHADFDYFEYIERDEK